MQEGIKFGIATYALHHNKVYFPNSFNFIPTHWILNETAGITTISIAPRAAFAPFSLGARASIAKTLAYLEMRIVLAKMVYQFDIRGVKGNFLGKGEPGLGVGKEGKTSIR